MFPTFAATTDSEERQLREKVIDINISMKFGVFIGIMLRKRHINSKSKQTIMMKPRSSSCYVHVLVKKVKAVYLQNEMIPSAGDFNEFEFFNCYLSKKKLFL